MAGNRQTSPQSDIIEEKIKEIKTEYRWVIGLIAGFFVAICIAAFSFMFHLYSSLSIKVDKLNEQTIRIDQKIEDMSLKK